MIKENKNRSNDIQIQLNCKNIDSNKLNNDKD